MEQRLLELFQKKNKWNQKDLEKELHLKNSAEFIAFVKALNALEDEKIICNDHTSYYLIDQKEYFTGKIKDISKFEYAVVNGDQKIYVSKNHAKDAFDGDEVLVHVDPKKNEVIHIYRRGIRKVAGTFYKRRKEFIFYSDVDLHRSFHIKNIDKYTIHNQDRAVLSIIKYSNPMECKIEKILGSEEEPGMDITSILYAKDVRTEFSNRVRKEVKDIDQVVTDKDRQNRKDLRDLFTITIDGDDARDFDDAISIEKAKDGYTLYVHIADVSHYVEEGSSIDKEAYARATSIYLCDRVIPMLPFELSNGICSLNPNVERCTITCKMNINSKGEIKTFDVFPSLIESNRRCTYQKVNALFDDRDTEYFDIQESLLMMKELAILLKEQSVERGNIDFESPEARIELDDRGKPIDVYVKTRGFAEEMIEQFMISANVCVAHLLNSEKIPGMYRIHQKPDPDRIESLMRMAYLMHIIWDFDPENITSKELQEFLDSIEDPYTREVMSMMTLRAMQKAVYSEKCQGHFGLGLEEYCHFTSPIRRYPDLIVHRMLRRYVFEKSDKNRDFEVSKIEKQALHASAKERDAITVERAVDDYKKAQYMEDHIGEVFEGIITGVAKFGFFVMLENTVEGLVPARMLQDDFYAYDDLHMRLIGENNGKEYTIGKRVKVACVEAVKEKGQVTFEVIGSKYR